MGPQLYRFRFDDALPMPAVRDALQLAIDSAEALYGPARVRLDFAYCADDDRQSLVIDARAAAGLAIARIFTGQLSALFGERAFQVRRIAQGPSDTPKEPPS